MEKEVLGIDKEEVRYSFSDQAVGKKEKDLISKDYNIRRHREQVGIVAKCLLIPMSSMM